MGFAIAQGRLGPGRIHHCMRLIGHAERCLGLTKERISQRVAFGKKIAEQGVWEERIGMSRIEIEQVDHKIDILSFKTFQGTTNDTTRRTQNGHCRKQGSCT